MNNLQLFNHAEFGGVRVFLEDGQPWLVGKDVAEILGYTDTDQAIRTHIDEEDKLTRKFDGSGQNRLMTIINESGLYCLILSSKLPIAKKFKRWVTSEVLPAIRKTGGYVSGNETDYIIKSITTAVMEQLPAMVAMSVSQALNAVLTEVKPSTKQPLLNLLNPSKAPKLLTSENIEETELWESLLIQWRNFRKTRKYKSEADKSFIALCRERYPELNIGRRTLYRKWRAYEKDGRAGLVDMRGRHGNHRRKVVVTVEIEDAPELKKADNEA